MLHDEQWLGQVEGVLIGAMDDREDALKHGKVITKACREYGEVIALPLETRIAELESFITNVDHNECGCGDSYGRRTDSFYMIMENGSCVNCRAADGQSFEIKDEFLSGLFNKYRRDIEATP